jgi:hypothetical protein
VLEPDAGKLACPVLRGGSYGNVTFLPDNIIRETTYGNLTGEKQDSFRNKDTTDSLAIDYRYTNDERNLIREKTMPEGWTIRYDYLSGTNLCTKVLHVYEGSVQERFFYTYGDLGELKTAIEDDGQREEEEDLTGVTYRRLKVIEAVKAKGPSFGKPQEEKHFCHSPQGWQLLKRIEYAYDDRGNEIKRRCDNQEAFCYETTKTYDLQRRVSEETDAVGRITRYLYDANGVRHEVAQILVVAKQQPQILLFDSTRRCV